MSGSDMDIQPPHIIDGHKIGNESLDTPHVIKPSEKLRSLWTRRNFLQLGAVGMGAFLMGDRIVTEIKWPREKTEIKIYETGGPPNGNLWLVLGGLGVVDSDEILHSLMPTLQSAQYAASVHYSDHGLDIDGLSEEVNRACKQLGGINHVNIYGHSMGGTLAEDVRDRLDESITRGVNAYDCTPLTKDFVQDKLLLEIIASLHLQGTYSSKFLVQLADRFLRQQVEDLTVAESMGVVMNMTNDKAGPSTVLHQASSLVNRTLDSYQNIPETADMWLLYPRDEISDTTVIIPELIPVFKNDIPGKKRLVEISARGHADPKRNSGPYNEALGKIWPTRVVYDSQWRQLTTHRKQMKPIDF